MWKRQLAPPLLSWLQWDHLFVLLCQGILTLCGFIATSSIIAARHSVTTAAQSHKQTRCSLLNWCVK